MLDLKVFNRVLKEINKDTLWIDNSEGDSI